MKKRAHAKEHDTQRVSRIVGTALPLRGNDIDTDQIIPARFMKVVTFDGLGQYAFYDVRFDENGQENRHPFNEREYKGANILISNSNFGCGSSREHAPQALMRFGIEAVVAESLAEIFAGNCAAMGVPAVRMTRDQIEELQTAVEADPGLQIEIDLLSESLKAGAREYRFHISSSYRSALLNGSWDSTAVLLSQSEAIRRKGKSLPYLNENPFK
ncbi:MAG: 3-isopropylmalate dehydratase small subunit [Spirochaetaceae bacterium]|nr:3-isopropylmalate dehydratase small subunit [Spirochaetaceae bacterium]MCF7947418.1 3-isopropylmalate dehydratase small subunit [Spirochaetia bacterium]MCF7951501.1 3-isopropylmalate dehydratase small subunit [Spirochaetaceae bacterium]